MKIVEEASFIDFVNLNYEDYRTIIYHFQLSVIQPKRSNFNNIIIWMVKFTIYNGL